MCVYHCVCVGWLIVVPTVCVFGVCVWVAVLVMMSNVLCRFHNEGVVQSMEYIILEYDK